MGKATKYKIVIIKHLVISEATEKPGVFSCLLFTQCFSSSNF